MKKTIILFMICARIATGAVTDRAVMSNGTNLYSNTHPASNYVEMVELELTVNSLTVTNNFELSGSARGICYSWLPASSLRSVAGDTLNASAYALGNALSYTRYKMCN